jgi:ABC-2 type transport system permease protein
MSIIAQPAVHSSWRSYVQEAKCEALQKLREPAYCLPVIGFPVLFYLLFGVLLDKGEGKAAQYLLATYGAFGVIGAGLFGFGVSIAVDREKGLLRLKRALPVPPGALLLARMAMAMLFAAIISLVLAVIAATVAGVALEPSQWIRLFVINVLGVLPFCAIGLFVGSVVGGSAAPALLNMLYLPMAFLSGLWLPLTLLPGFLSTIAPAWPAYHLGQLALKVVGFDAGQPIGMHVGVLAGITLLFFVLAQRRLSAAE